jgi:hypothetical protein
MMPLHSVLLLNVVVVVVVVLELCCRARLLLLHAGFRSSDYIREFAKEISLISLGSSQTFRLPQPSTEAARRFWSFKDTMVEKRRM